MIIKAEFDTENKTIIALVDGQPVENVVGVTVNIYPKYDNLEDTIFELNIATNPSYKTRLNLGIVQGKLKQIDENILEKAISKLIK